MQQGFEDDDRESLPLQPEFSSSGPGGRIKTAIGLFGDGSSIDPTLLTEDPPFWFFLRRGQIYTHYCTALQCMDKTRALQILSAAGLPPLCILTLGLRFRILPREDFDYLDLQAVFDVAGHSPPEFGKFLDKLQDRCLYHLDRTWGVKNRQMLESADFSELRGQP